MSNPQESAYGRSGRGCILVTLLLLPILMTGASALAQNNETAGKTKKATAMTTNRAPSAEKVATSVNRSTEDEGVAEANGDLFHIQQTLASGAVVVIEESRNEPRSLGSYSIRLYSGANPEFPLDDFRHGLVLVRDGFIEQAQFLSPNLLIIVIRSAASGNYLSGTLVRAEAKLEVLGTLQGLSPDAELLEQLRALAASHPEAD